MALTTNEMKRRVVSNQLYELLRDGKLDFVVLQETFNSRVIAMAVMSVSMAVMNVTSYPNADSELVLYRDPNGQQDFDDWCDIVSAHWLDFAADEADLV